MQPPVELKQLMDDIDNERVERARRMPLDQKFLAGFDLFQRAVGLMRVGVRAQFPQADEVEVARIVRERLAQTHHSDEELNWREHHGRERSDPAGH